MVIHASGADDRESGGEVLCLFRTQAGASAKGTACHVKKADMIEGVIDDVLGIRDKETTEDGRFTLERVNCIGACAKAPNIMVDDVVYGELTKEKVEKILKEFPKE